MTAAPVRAGKADRKPGQAADRAPRGRTATDRVADTRTVRASALLSELAARLGPAAAVPVDAGERAGRAVRARGATGLLSGGRILLDPARFDPATARGRYLLAHEATHAAQRAEIALRPDRRRPSVAEAEREADRIGMAFAAGRAVAPPVMVLPPGEIAADTGVLSAPDAIRSRYPELIDDVTTRLHPALWVSDSDVDYILRWLDAIEQADAAGVVYALTAEDRLRLVHNIGEGHVRHHRKGVIAMLAGLSPRQREELPTNRYRALDLHGITRQQYNVLVEAVHSLSESKVSDILSDTDTAAPWRRLLSSAPGELDLIAPAPEAGPPPPTGEQRAADASRREQLARDPQVVEALEALRRLPEQPAAAEAKRALEMLKSLRTSASGDRPSASEGRASPPPQDDDRFAYVVERLDPEGVMTRLLAATGHDEVRSAGFTEWDATVRAIVRHAPDAASHLTEQLLRSWLFDWFVTGAAAERAFAVLEELAGSHPERIPPLDARGYVDRTFNHLPAETLYREDIRERTRTIMAAREPQVRIDKARSLLSLGIFDWAVTARDAFLAFQMVRSLPARQRQAFQDLEGGLYWARMIREMTDSMRAALDLTTARGGDEAREASSIRLQLSDNALWQSGPVNDVRVLVGLAVDFGDHRWVFDRSKQVNAYRRTELLPVVERFQLYDPDQGRSDYRPLPVRGTTVFEEGPFAFLAGLGRGVGILFGGQLHIESLMPFIGGLHRLDIGEAVRAGRELGGQDVGLEAAPSQQARDNIADIEYNSQTKMLDVTIATLRLASYSYLEPAKTIRFGAATFTNLVLHAELDPRGQRDVSSRIDLSGMRLQDLLYATTTTVSAVSQLDLGGVHVTSRATGEEVIGGPTRGIEVGLVDTMMAALATRAGLRASSIRIDGLYVDGRRITSIELSDVQVSTQPTRTAYLTELLARHDIRLNRTTDPDRRAAYQRRRDEVAELLRQQQRYEELTHLAATRPLTEPEREEQQKLATLTQRQGNTGAVVSLGSLKVRGVGGDVDIASLDLADIVGGGELSRPFFEWLTDPALVRRFLRAGVPATAAPDVDTLALDVGDVDLRDVGYVGALPTSAQLAELRDQAATDPPERARLAQLVEAAQRYELLSQRLAGRDTPLSDADRSDLLAARDQLRAYARLSVARVSLTDAVVGVPVHGGQAQLAARELLVEGVAGTGVEVDRISGHDVALSANRAPGKEGLAALTGAGLQAGTLQVSGIRYAGSQAPLASLTVTGADVAAQKVPNGWHIAPLTFSTLTIDRLDLHIGERRLSSPDPLMLGDITGDVTVVTAPGTMFQITRVDIADVRIGRIEGQRLHYTDGSRSLDVSGRVRNLEFTGISWDVATSRATATPAPAPAAGTTPSQAASAAPSTADQQAAPAEGRITLGTVDQLSVAGTFAAGVQGVLGIHSAPSGGSALAVGIDEAGAITVTLNLEAVDLPRMQWHGDDGTRLDADEPVALRGLTARVRPHLGPDHSLQAVDVDSLHADELRTGTVHYADQARTVDLTHPPGGPPAVVVRGIDVSGVHWAQGQALSAVPFRAAAQSLEIASADYVEGTLRATGATLRAAAIRVQHGADGAIAASAGELSGRADVSGGGFTGRVEFDRAALDVTYADGELRIGHDTTPGLAVPRLVAESISFASSSVSISGAGPVTFEGVSVAGAVRASRGADGKPDWTRFTIEFTLLHVDTLRARGLDIVVPRPTGALHVELPAAREAVITGLQLRPPAGAATFAVNVDTASKSVTASGLVDAQRIVIPRVTATLGSWLTVRTGIKAESVTAGIASSGDLTFDIGQLTLRRTQVSASLTPTSTPPSTLPIDLAVIQGKILDAIRPVRSLFEHVQGNIDLTLNFTIPYLGPTAIPLKITVIDGSVNPFDIERQLLPTPLQGLLYFKLSGGQLRLVFDPTVLLAVTSVATGPSPVLPILTVTNEITLLEWTLSTGEYHRLETSQLIQVDRLIDFAITRSGKPFLSPIPGTGGPSTGPSTFRITGIDGYFDITNPATLPLDLITPPAPGSPAPTTAGVRALHVDLAPDALIGLHAAGNIGAGAGRLVTEVRRFSLDHLQISYDDPATGLRISASTGAVGVRGVTGGADFTDFDPTAVRARGREATAEGVHVEVHP